MDCKETGAEKARCETKVKQDKHSAFLNVPHAFEKETASTSSSLLSTRIVALCICFSIFAGTVRLLQFSLPTAATSHLPVPHPWRLWTCAIVETAPKAQDQKPTGIKSKNQKKVKTRRTQQHPEPTTGQLGTLPASRVRTRRN